MIIEEDVKYQEVTEIELKIKIQNKKAPNLYQVIMHNDDYTPMEFVVRTLELFFHMDRETAVRLMYEVHKTGQAICGAFSRDVAETKATLVTDFARQHEHPLLCSVEVT